MYQVPLYQVYKEDQDQISGATYISDVVFYKCHAYVWLRAQSEAILFPYPEEEEPEDRLLVA